MGHQGMLAQALKTCFSGSDFTAVTLGRPVLDITQAWSIRQALAEVLPSIVINAAAYTAVDQAESDWEQAFAVNRDGTAHVAAACYEKGIPLIHISTDYVFDGAAERPYREDDPPGPLGVYGESKWQGEVAIRTRHPEHVIVRTAWIYSQHGHNFLKTMLRLARERDELRVVNDQHGCPTWSLDLAEALLMICQQIQRDRNAVPWGTYHFCSAEPTTWFDFTQAIIEMARSFEPLQVRNIVPIPASGYPTPAQRPANSVLDCAKIQATFGIEPQPWRERLCYCMKELYRCTATPLET